MPLIPIPIDLPPVPDVPEAVETVVEVVVPMESETTPAVRVPMSHGGSHVEVPPLPPLRLPPIVPDTPRRPRQPLPPQMPPDAPRGPQAPSLQDGVPAGPVGRLRLPEEPRMVVGGRKLPVTGPEGYGVAVGFGLMMVGAAGWNWLRRLR